MRMQDVEFQARHLFEALGPRAIPVAARRALRHREAGEDELARLWRRVEARLIERRGPRQA